MMENFEAYPLRFYPILKDRIWGGTLLKDILDKPVTSTTTGESWEISAVEGDVSVASNGIFKDLPLTEIIRQFPEQLLGKSVYKRFGANFPLLFKFIDAREDLSIQVHPNDKLAMERHGTFGKTEMWYVINADPGARLIIGFKEKSSQGDYLKYLEKKELPKILRSYYPKSGDAFYLETGTVHAIGAGIMVAEIQQSSDVTYRVYDWDRVDSAGKPRELHTGLALDAINYDVVNPQREYAKAKNAVNPIVDSAYFTTSLIPVDGVADFDYDGESFRVLMCVDGDCEIHFDSRMERLKLGETVLIPAALQQYQLSGNASILEIRIG